MTRPFSFFVIVASIYILTTYYLNMTDRSVTISFVKQYEHSTDTSIHGEGKTLDVRQYLLLTPRRPFDTVRLYTIRGTIIDSTFYVMRRLSSGFSFKLNDHKIELDLAGKISIDYDTYYVDKSYVKMLLHKIKRQNIIMDLAHLFEHRLNDMYYDLEPLAEINFGLNSRNRYTPIQKALVFHQSTQGETTYEFPTRFFRNDSGELDSLENDRLKINVEREDRRYRQYRVSKEYDKAQTFQLIWKNKRTGSDSVLTEWLHLGRAEAIFYRSYQDAPKVFKLKPGCTGFDAIVDELSKKGVEVDLTRFTL